MKLVAREPETDALIEWLHDRPLQVSSILSAVELLRAARRAAAKDGAVVERAAAVIASVALLGLSDAVAERAAAVAPRSLRSLDAVHLATAILAGPLDAFVAYDARLIDAARDAGLRVVRPA